MKNLLKPLTKSVSIPLKSAQAASTTDSAIQKNIFGSGMTTMIISNEEINDIMKIIKSLKQAGLLKKRVSNTDENKTKAQKDAILEMSLGTLSVTLLRSLLTSKRVIRACGSVIRAGGGRIRATKDFLYCLILYLVLKHKDIIKMDLNFMMFIQEINYLK